MNALAESLRALELQRCRALLMGDLAQVEAGLSPALTYVHAPGMRHDRPQLMHFLREQVRYHVLERRGLSIEVREGLAVMTGLMRLEAVRVPSLQPVKATSFVTQVWTHDAGRWQMRLFQATQVDASLWDEAELPD